MLAALGTWGFETGDGPLGFVLGIGAPLLAIAIWGAFIAPKARRPVPLGTRLLLELLLFGAAVVALVAAGLPVTGVLLGVLAVGSSLLNAAQERRGAG
jgi:hypothetical protein